MHKYTYLTVHRIEIGIGFVNHEATVFELCEFLSWPGVVRPARPPRFFELCCSDYVWTHGSGPWTMGADGDYVIGVENSHQKTQLYNQSITELIKKKSQGAWGQKRSHKDTDNIPSELCHISKG
jgi:hypothetical protein